MGDAPGTLLFTVSCSHATVGVPPKDLMDNFQARRTLVGRCNVQNFAFNPEGEFFAVYGMELYRGYIIGSVPPNLSEDWRVTAKRVLVMEQDMFRFLFFHPKGFLYVVTKNGDFYMGPAPSNDKVSWFNGEATKIGNAGWNRYDALFFDLKGNLYAVTNDRLMMGNPPTKPDDDWLGSSTTIGEGGWHDLSLFMVVSPDGHLWCVNSKNGNLYKGPIPTKKEPNYMAKAVHVGLGFNFCIPMAFTIDKTMQSIVSFEFMADSGKILSQSPEVLKTETYVNTSSIPLKETFSFSESVTDKSSFSQDHGFKVGVEAELTFKAGVPFVAETEAKITVKASTTHNWNFTKSNETQKTFTESSNVEVPPGKSIKKEAIIKKVELDIPYRARIRTLFGYETTITGNWNGVKHYDLRVEQKDIK